MKDFRRVICTGTEPGSNLTSASFTGYRGYQAVGLAKDIGIKKAVEKEHVFCFSFFQNSHFLKRKHFLKFCGVSACKYRVPQNSYNQSNLYVTLAHRCTLRRLRNEFISIGTLEDQTVGQHPAICCHLERISRDFQEEQTEIGLHVVDC